MKKYFIISLMVLGACKTIKSSRVIQYVLPQQVEVRLSTNLNTLKAERIAFSLSQLNDSTYVITLIKYLRNEQYKIDKFGRILKTNRFLLVEQKFYPLLFELDYQFGTDLNKQSIMAGIEEKWINESLGVPRANPIYDNSFSIVFNKNGKIISESYGMYIKAVQKR